jgi:hypothetical protein
MKGFIERLAEGIIIEVNLGKFIYALIEYT